MRRDLEQSYIPSCVDCQRNKSTTSKRAGPLHPLPIPEQRGDSIAMDFIGPLPPDSNFNCILSITDRLNSDIRIIPIVSTFPLRIWRSFSSIIGTARTDCRSKLSLTEINFSSQNSGPRYISSLASNLSFLLHTTHRPTVPASARIRPSTNVSDITSAAIKRVGFAPFRRFVLIL
jgi:hypothetical protein